MSRQVLTIFSTSHVSAKRRTSSDREAARHSESNLSGITAMPVTVRAEMRALNEQEFSRVTYAVMGHVFDVRNEFGGFIRRADLSPRDRAPLRWHDRGSDRSLCAGPPKTVLHRPVGRRRSDLRIEDR